MRTRALWMLPVCLLLAATAHGQTTFDFIEFKLEGDNAVTNGAPAAAVEFEADVVLGDGSNGVQPDGELTWLRIGPDPRAARSSWVVSIPAGCFMRGMRQYEVADFRRCGVQLLSRDDATGTDTDITHLLSGFEASIRTERNTALAKIAFDVEGSEVFGGIVPCLIDFHIGDDAVMEFMFDSQFEGGAAGHPPERG